MLGRLSDHPGTLIIGSDPAEWWRGHEARAVWGRQLEEFGGSFHVTASEIDAWEEGSVGWASVKETIEWEGTIMAGRATYVLHLEHDEWKVVRVHGCAARGHRRPDGRRRIDARLLERSTGGRLRKSNPAIDPSGTLRGLASGPGSNRCPHRRRAE